MKKLSNDEFVESIVDVLDGFAEEVDEPTVSKLDMARENAMAKVAADARLVNAVQQALAESENLPTQIDTKLDAMRKQALASGSKPANLGAQIWQQLNSIFPSAQFNLSRSLIATACVTLTVASVFYNLSEPSNLLSTDEEFSVIAASEEIELYENLDFYLWLEENELLN